MLDFDAIDDSLLVGSAFERDDVPLLLELGVGAVVSLQAECADPIDALAGVGIAWARIECEDFCAPSIVQLENAVSALGSFASDGRRVYLHCFAGLQRSVTVAACYLIHSDPQRWNARSALERVKARRRNACPIRTQIDAILDFDRLVRASRGI